jgi:hypothetical protein
MFTELLLGNGRGINFTEPLPWDDRRDIYTDRLMGGIYEVHGRVRSSAMTYVPSLVKIV